MPLTKRPLFSVLNFLAISIAARMIRNSAISLRLPAGPDPIFSNNQSQVVIQSQCQHGGAPNGSYANDLNAIHTPREMIFPTLLAWIE